MKDRLFLAVYYLQHKGVDFRKKSFDLSEGEITFYNILAKSLGSKKDGMRFYEDLQREEFLMSLDREYNEGAVELNSVYVIKKDNKQKDSGQD